MNNDQLTGILRAIVPAVVGYFAAKGYVPQAVAGDFGSALVTVVSVLAMAGWSFHNNKTGKTIQ